MAALGADTYRMSLEWARIEPEEGHFDEKALAHYRREVEGFVARGIRPLVTLHHFSNPLWFEDSGGFENERSVERFVRYARRRCSSPSPLRSGTSAKSSRPRGRGAVRLRHPRSVSARDGGRPRRGRRRSPSQCARLRLRLSRDKLLQPRLHPLPAAAGEPFRR